MSHINEIARTVHLLRRMPQIDIERLSYELSEDEWMEFAKELHAGLYMNNQDLSYADHCMFMGIAVRKRATAGKGANDA